METQNQREPENAGGDGRRPYERPAVSWEEDFEPYVFSTCGKMLGQGGACTVAMRKS
jgi:hypothetical protein